MRIYLGCRNESSPLTEAYYGRYTLARELIDALPKKLSTWSLPRDWVQNRTWAAWEEWQARTAE